MAPVLARLRKICASAVGRGLYLLERVLLLLEIGGQQAHHLVRAHRGGVGDQAFIDGNLVVLGFRRPGGDHGVDKPIIGLFDVGLSLLLDPLDRRAGLVLDFGS